MLKKPIITICTTLILLPAISLAAEKVTLCHKGKTITVSKSAAQKHRKLHGDTLGPCPEVELDKETTEADLEAELELEIETEADLETKKVTLCHKGKTITVSKS
ncbi:MAG: hypothetical protein D3924_06535, partial [Candidatus Electrothrix sp. AR4]|nr:hypothetical protein [Candidatus Electrothrix sp. AR4]